MKLTNNLKNNLDNKANQIISRLLKPMADTMLKTAYDLTDKSLSYEDYSKKFYELYKINYQNRKEK